MQCDSACGRVLRLAIRRVPPKSRDKNATWDFAMVHVYIFFVLTQQFSEEVRMSAFKRVILTEVHL